MSILSAQGEILAILPGQPLNSINDKARSDLKQISYCSVVIIVENDEISMDFSVTVFGALAMNSNNVVLRTRNPNPNISVAFPLDNTF